MENLLIVCGPTATGKTSLGVKLAKKYSGEIVSADSRQVYQGLDIGTGKDLPKNSKLKTQSAKWRTKLGIKKLKIGYHEIDEVRVWLYDTVRPDFQFSVADYIDCAEKIIKDIWSRKKLPIVLGGTGFYIKGLLDGIETIGFPPDKSLRKRLAGLTIAELEKELISLAPEKWREMNESDRKNPRRLIRAVEVAGKRKRKRTKREEFGIGLLKPGDILVIGLMSDYQELYRRIDKRVDDRLEEGMIDEIKGLLDRGYNWENSILGATIDYRVWQPYFNKETSLEETVQRWKYAIHAYARRQMTWFKKDKRVSWFEIADKDFFDKVERKVREWYYRDQDGTDKN